MEIEKWEYAMNYMDNSDSKESLLEFDISEAESPVHLN